MSREQLIFGLLDIAAVVVGFAIAHLRTWTPSEVLVVETLCVLSCSALIPMLIWRHRPRYRPQIRDVQL